MRCSATSIFYQIKKCSGIWVSEVQRANRIYCVVRPDPERLKGVEGESAVALAYFLRIFIPYS